jgi:hypothetical protein
MRLTFAEDFRPAEELGPDKILPECVCTRRQTQHEHAYRTIQEERHNDAKSSGKSLLKGAEFRTVRLLIVFFLLSHLPLSVVDQNNIFSGSSSGIFLKHEFLKIYLYY